MSSRGRGRGTNLNRVDNRKGPARGSQFGGEFLGQNGPLSSSPRTRAGFIQRNRDLNA